MSRGIKVEGAIAFFVEEDEFGVAKFPASANTIVLADGVTFPTQPTSHTDAKEVSSTRSITDVMRDLRDAGSLALPVYMRPSGTAGQVPSEGGLLKALLGKETINAGNVTYECAVDKPTGTFWMKTKTGEILFATGVGVKDGKFGQEGKSGQPKIEFGAEFQRLGWAGATTTFGALSGGETDVTVASGKVLSVGAHVSVGSSTNAGAGHEITAIAANVITVTPAITGAQDNGVAVTPVLPAATPIGAPMPYRPAVKIDGTAVNWQKVGVTITDPLAWETGECTADPAVADYPTDFTAQAGRKVEAETTALFRPENIAELLADDTDKAFEVDYTPTAPAGSQVVISLPQGRYSVAELAKGNTAIERTLKFNGKATSAGEDEIAIVYS